MCEHCSSVQRWLQNLRFTTEDYDPSAPTTEVLDQSVPDVDFIIKFPNCDNNTLRITSRVDQNCDTILHQSEPTRNSLPNINCDQSDNNIVTSEIFDQTVPKTNSIVDDPATTKNWDQSVLKADLPKTNCDQSDNNIVTSDNFDRAVPKTNAIVAYPATAKNCDQSGPIKVSKMTSESENLKRLSALSGSYENIWNCTTEFGKEIALKYGHACRISFEFDETIQELCIAPVIFTQFDFGIPANILQWKSELRFDCSSEEDDQEYEKSLERINEEKGQTCFNQTRPFPVETTVEIRHNSGPVRRGSNRSQTVHEFAYGNLQQQLEESYVDLRFDIKGVIKICYDGTTKKLSKGQILRICGDQLVVVSDKGEEEVIIDHLNQTQYKPTSRKEVTITKTTDEMCKVYRVQFDGTKDLNLAVIDFEQYYGSDRPYYSKLQTTGEEKLQIRHKLLKLLGKRSSKDLLEKKGIIRNEPIFGNTLKHLYEMYKQDVPAFVIRIVQLIELPKNIKSVGLYRASGNLATIQKIRFHIDKNNLKVLDEFKNDIDVLTGSLKLFFRELKEPLIPHKTYEELCKYIDQYLSTKAEEHIKHLVNKLDRPHKRTLLTLLEHLLKVESQSEENRMDAYNISIVWGPTLIWPPDNCHENILLSHTNANKVVELLLHVYKKVYDVPRTNESSPKISYKEGATNEAARQKNALMLELSENLTHSLRRAASKDNMMKSTDSLTKSKDDHHKSPDKELKYDLEHLCGNTKEKIPEFVLKVVPLIEKGIGLEFLYRRSGSNEKLEKIKKKISRTKSNLNSMEKYNVHDLAWALKNFFFELTAPLIPKVVFERLVLATDERIEVTKLRNSKKELSSASIPYRETLDYLLRHLVKVSLHEEANKMSKHNIAMEWAPILCRSFIENYEISAGSCIQVLETLLQIYDTKTVINMETEKDLKRNIEVYNSIYNSENRMGRSPDKLEGSYMTSAHILGRSPDKYDKSTNQVLPTTFKRKTKLTKNDSSLHRVSRFITNTFSMYDNVHYAEDVRDEATILETAPANNSKKGLEDRTKL